MASKMSDKQNGKGDRPRKLSIPLKEYEKRWEDTFKKKDKDEDKKRIRKQ